jgi:flavin-dependent dehydrogenase
MPAMPDWDVLVVGGGPAGTSTALELTRRGSLSVLAVERTDYDRPRIGETLSPAARALLDHLRAPAYDDGHRPAYGTSAAWGSAQLVTRDFLMTPFGAGWHLDRRRFDERLAAAARKAGAEVWTSSRVRDLRRDGDGFVASVRRADGGTRPVRARFVVDATGKAASVARRLGGDHRRLDGLVGIAATMRYRDEPPAESLTLVESFEHGWSYTAPLPGRELIAVVMTDAGLARRLDLTRPDAWLGLLTGLPHSGPRLAGGGPAEAPRVLAAHSACLARPSGPGWAAVGDAAASHDPLSSTGIVRALESGIHAARAIHATLVRGDRDALAEYDRRQDRAFDWYCDTRTAYYRMEARWPSAPFWHRRHRLVSLDPSQPLAAAGPEPRKPRLPADLRHVDAARLLALAAAGSPSHELAAGYRAEAAQPVRDLDLILALQWLTANGDLVRTAADQRA